MRLMTKYDRRYMLMSDTSHKWMSKKKINKVKKKIDNTCQTDC